MVLPFFISVCIWYDYQPLNLCDIRNIYNIWESAPFPTHP
jgi:hypothetical protein